MRKLEKILISFCLLTFVLYLTGTAGGIVLLFSAFSLICIHYLLFGFFMLNGIGFRALFRKSSYTTVTARDTILGILGSMGLFIIIAGIMFKIFCWIGAYQLLLFGMLLLVAISLFAVLHKERTVFDRRLLQRTIPFFCIAVIVFFVPWSMFDALRPVIAG